MCYRREFVELRNEINESEDKQRKRENLLLRRIAGRRTSMIK